MSLDRCSSCGSEHLAPVPCGMSFRERLATLRIDPSALSVRREVQGKYIDTQSLNETLGGEPAERRERMLEETDGVGYIRKDASGRFVHPDRKTGDLVPLSEKEATRFMGGEE